MEQTAVEWYEKQIWSLQLKLEKKEISIGIYALKRVELFEQAKEMEKQQKILLVEQLKDYTKEAQCILGNDEREASEFVEIFYKTTFKSE